MNPSIKEYIRANRERYTREAVIEQLVQAGHRRWDVEAAWAQLEAEEPMGSSTGANMSAYAWIIFGLGAAAIAIPTVLGLVNGGGFGLFGVGWLIAYLAIAVWPTRAFARSRPGTLGGVVAVVLAVPIVVLLIGGGLCIGTVLVILQMGSY